MVGIGGFPRRCHIAELARTAIGRDEAKAAQAAFVQRPDKDIFQLRAQTGAIAKFQQFSDQRDFTGKQFSGGHRVSLLRGF